jgi:peptidoglycan/xylan/chitin deacetylase (PgdA/CDA1 family)
VILFLTYHKVMRGPEREPEFYTVPIEQLERQLEMIAEKGLRPIAVEELVDLRADNSASPGPSAEREGDSFILSFDDGTVDHYDVVCPLLEKVGRKGFFFVPTAKLNRPGHLTNNMVTEMAKAGHTIGLHGHEHRRLDEFGDEDIRVQMEVSRAMLRDLIGTPPITFAPPGGYMNHGVQAIALETGVRVIRTMRWGYNRRVDLTALECIPVNRHSTEAEFTRVLEFRSQAVAYAAKQITRTVVPKSIYEPLRDMVARMGKGGA